MSTNPRPKLERPKLGRPSDLELIILALLALSHPKALDAINLYVLLWEMKKFPAGISRSEAMTLMLVECHNAEARGYAHCVDADNEVFYSLSPTGAALFADQAAQQLLGEMSQLPGWALLSGKGLPC